MKPIFMFLFKIIASVLIMVIVACALIIAIIFWDGEMLDSLTVNEFWTEVWDK